ncbi:hypothetical protein Fcan01_21781 [Folsomia candida]|uniref:Uncharacterized protein n=1 Tax=Folsomia candida TaxID=158441 RepID=A0A226DH51_FOLCA|nr:hypothetical protein Fcan01_21781 [Folsomia candida]
MPIQLFQIFLDKSQNSGGYRGGENITGKFVIVVTDEYSHKAQARLGKSPPRPGPIKFGSSKAQARPSPVADRPTRPKPNGPGRAHLKPRPGSLLKATISCYNDEGTRYLKDKARNLVFHF